MLTPRPYQEAGADFLAARESAILGDSMGLGKTATAALALRRTQALRVLWVAPAATLPGLRRELPRWGLPDPVVVSPSANLEAPLLLLSVDAAAAYRDRLLRSPCFDVMVLDEAHTCKNPSAKRTRAVYRLRIHCQRFWALTGTPMPSRPIELQTMLFWGCRQEWAERKRYGDRYCWMPNMWLRCGFDYNGCTSTATKELPGLLAPIMLRRRPEDIPGELPDIRRILVPLDVREPRLEFDRQTALDALAERGSIPVEMISRYRAEMGRKKIARAAAWISDWAEENPNESAVVFAWHQDVIDGLAQALGAKYSASGESTPRQRQQMVDAWAAGRGDDDRLFIASIAACGTGLNGLHKRATACVFVEFPYTPGEVQQAEGRIRRLGGVAESPVAYFLAAPDESLETHILCLILEKLGRQARILDPIGDLV